MQAEFCYGEGLDMLQHALQAAHAAALEGAWRQGRAATLPHPLLSTLISIMVRMPVSPCVDAGRGEAR